MRTEKYLFEMRTQNSGMWADRSTQKVGGDQDREWEFWEREIKYLSKDSLFPSFCGGPCAFS